MDLKGEPAQRIALSLSLSLNRSLSREVPTRRRWDGGRQAVVQATQQLSPGQGSVLAGREQERSGVWCQCVSGCGDLQWDWEVWDRVPVLPESSLLGR